MKKIFISKKAQKHSSKGSFVYSKDGKHQYKMTGGGHGQENIDYLKTKNIPYKVVWKYTNGVIGGNISIHHRTNHKVGDMQCWFPESWCRSDIGLIRDMVKRMQGEQANIAATDIIDSINGHECLYAAGRSRKENILAKVNN